MLPIPLIVGSAAFIQAFDTSAVAVALPAMADHFQVSALSLDMVITAYLLGATACVSLSGWASDRYGARRTFLAGIALFGLASLACAAAPSLSTLIAARVIQGGAGALLLPVGRVIVLRSEPRERLVQAVAMLTFPVMLGPVIGPLAGGAITQIGSWRWLFLIDAAASVAGLLLVLRHVPAVGAGAAKPLDGVGWLLMAIGLGGLTFGMGELVRGETVRLDALLVMLVAVGCGLLYRRHARRRPDPIVDLSVLRLSTSRLANVGGIFTRQLVSATPFLLALLFQIGFGLSPLAAGALIFAGAIGSLLGRSLLGYCLTRVGFRWLLALNGLALAATTAACALLTPATPYAAILILLFFQGASRSLQNIALMTVSYAEVPDPEIGAASTIASVSQYLAFSLGIAAAVCGMSLFGAASGGTPLSLSAIRPVFVLLGLLSLLSSFWIMRLRAPASMGAARREAAERRIVGED